MTSVSHVAHDIKSLDLADAGRRKIEWADRQMPVLAAIRARFEQERPLAGLRIASCQHVTTETANLMRTLKAAGADVVLCASNPLSTQDEVAAAMVVHYGIGVFAIRGIDADGYYRHLDAAIDTKPNFCIDDGADVIGLMHSTRDDALGDMMAASEETTTGVIRLRALEAQGRLAFPVIAVNDAQTKHLFDNRYGTGPVDARRHHPRDQRAARRPRLRGRRLRLVRPRAGQPGARHGRARDRHRGRSAARARGHDGRLRRDADGRGGAAGDIFCTATGDKHVIRGEHIEQHEGRRDPLQHRPLQRRDRHPGARGADGRARRRRGRTSSASR